MRREIKNHPLKKNGSFDDDSIAHVASGEIIIPRPILEANPALKEFVFSEIKKRGIDPNSYVIGEDMEINQETGLPEFGWFKKLFGFSGRNLIKKAAPFLLPIAAIAAPFAFPATMASIGGALGAGAAAAPMVGGGLTSALLSGVGSAVQGKPVGQSLLSAGLGGLGGALASGGGSAIAGAAGLTGTGAKIASGALTGAAFGGASGGGSGALKGAITGGAMAGLGSLGDAASSTADGLSGVTSQAGYGGAGMSVPETFTPLTSGSGLAAGGGASAMNLGDALKLGSSIYSGYSTMDANDEMQKQLLEQQNKAAGLMSPYTEAGGQAATQLSDALTQGFNYEDYANTPAYQMQLAEGQKAIQQQLAAQGLGQSGAAVKAATEYGTGLANQNYGDAYNQWLQQNQQLGGLANTGSGAASNLGNIYGDIGMTGALATGANQNAMNNMLSGVSSNPLIEALLKKSGMFA